MRVTSKRSFLLLLAGAFSSLRGERRRPPRTGAFSSLWHGVFPRSVRAEFLGRPYYDYYNGPEMDFTKTLVQHGW